MRTKACLLFFALTLIIFINACIPNINLKLDALPKGSMTLGSVAVGTVLNNREADFGGKSFELFGRMPFELKPVPGREIDIVLKETAKAALEHTGYSTERISGKSYRLDMDLMKFWCSGYTGYKVEADIVVKLLDPAGVKVLAQKNISVWKVFVLIAGYGPVYSAFDEVINGIQKELVTFMQSPEFRNAVK